MTHPKNNKKSIPDPLAETIEEEMVFGYKDKTGTKQYPTLKNSAEWYNISYDALRQLAKTWNWKQKRNDHQQKVSQKVAEKQKSEERSDEEAEAIVVDNYRFNKAANKLRRAVVKEIDKISNGDVVLFITKEGEKIKGVPKNAAYYLMNAGKALESAQKISKTSAGEPSEIRKVEGEGKFTITDPTGDVQALEDTLKKKVGMEDFDGAIEKFSGEKVGRTNENSRKSDISDL